MLDAVRISGRWISKSLLEKMTERTLETNPPTRQQWLQEFCRRTDWRNRKGELCLSSANVGVNVWKNSVWCAGRQPPLERPVRPDANWWMMGRPCRRCPNCPPRPEQISDLHAIGSATSGSRAQTLEPPDEPGHPLKALPEWAGNCAT